MDLHQHIWTQPLLDALERRCALPLVRRAAGLTVLHSAAEQAYVIDEAAEAPAAQLELADEDQIDLAVVALSSPIGIEALPRDSALALIDAYLEGVAQLPERFAAWGPIALDRPDPDDVDALLDRGCVGISLPAGALDGQHRLERIGAVLERVQLRQVPLFVHPGRAPGQFGTEPLVGEPLWWRALTDYVSQMQSAWLTVAACGRREFPELVAVFAMLAGGAPLQIERLLARGGPKVELRDPNTYYDTSSYGPTALELYSRRIGEHQLVYGSDRPVVEPVRSGREVVLQENAARLLVAVGAPA